MPDPIAFVVMPFNTKSTGSAQPDAPVSVDFDALWDNVYQPVLTGLGYKTVRADRDIGASIIREMVQRLAIADLVVADISVSNANVYYEIGVRHAAQQHGCVLVAADWAQPVFDLRQIRQLRFPLPDGRVGEWAAARARDVLSESLEVLAVGVSPVFDAIPGYPGAPELDQLSAFREEVEQLSEFQADVRAVRLSPEAQRSCLARALLETHGSRRVVRESVVLELLRVVRDHLGWQDVLDYIASLPPHLATNALVKEQYALALSYIGDVAAAAARLEQLIDTHGPTAERLGLLAGRYKALAEGANSTHDRRRNLSRAIKTYEQGMLFDLNGYYTSSNLPRLYRLRAGPDDERLAQVALVATTLACRAAAQRGTADEWLRLTELANAFDRGDVAEAERLRGLVEDEGVERWKLGRSIDDLRLSVRLCSDETVRAGLAAVLDWLEGLVPNPPATGP